MNPKDKNGKEIAVGSIINVQAKVVSITRDGDDAMLSATTLIEHGAEKKVYGLPVLHGSQVEVVSE